MKEIFFFFHDVSLYLHDYLTLNFFTDMLGFWYLVLIVVKKRKEKL